VFWSKVSKGFKKETEHKLVSLKRHVNKLVEKRRNYLKKLKTGDENSENTYTIAIDAWIKVVNDQKTVKTVKKITVKKKLTLKQETVRVRNNLMMQMSKKCHLDALKDTDNDDDTVLNENDDLSQPHSSFILSVLFCS